MIYKDVNDLYLRVCKCKKINSALLSEIVNARSYIVSLNVKDKELTKIAYAFDIVISKSFDAVKKPFVNPLYKDNMKDCVAYGIALFMGIACIYAFMSLRYLLDLMG